MPREKVQSPEKERPKVPMRATVADRVVVVSKPRNGGGAKGAAHCVSVMETTSKGGTIEMQNAKGELGMARKAAWVVL